MLTEPARHMLPPGYALRVAARGDIPGVLALWRAVEIARYGESDSTEDKVLEEWSLPRLDHDDRWVVEAQGGEIVGYAMFWLENPPREAIADQWVHPGPRGLGLSECLLELGEARAKAAAVRVPDGMPLSLGVFTDAGDSGRLDLFARHGFAQAREFLRMETTLEAWPSPAVLPTGIELRGFRRGHDEAAVHAATDEAFRDHFRPSRWTLDEWITLRFARPDLDLNLWWVAWDGQEVAGSILAFILPTGAYIEELSVRRPWRGRGLGRALLLHAFGALYGRGQRRIFLGVDSINPTGARRVYEAAGMKPTRRHVFWEKDVRP